MVQAPSGLLGMSLNKNIDSTFFQSTQLPMKPWNGLRFYKMGSIVLSFTSRLFLFMTRCLKLYISSADLSFQMVNLNRTKPFLHICILYLLYQDCGSDQDLKIVSVLFFHQQLNIKKWKPKGTLEENLKTDALCHGRQDIW